MTVAPRRLLVWRVAHRVEQEIRAYPRLYSLFYRALTASPAVRSAVGRVKSGVRADAASRTAETPPDCAGVAEQRRAAAIAARLRLSTVAER